MKINANKINHFVIVLMCIPYPINLVARSTHNTLPRERRLIQLYTTMS